MAEMTLEYWEHQLMLAKKNLDYEKDEAKRAGRKARLVFCEKKVEELTSNK